MKRATLIILAIIVITTGCSSPQFRVVEGMVIQGHEQFYDDIMEGLDLLKDKAPEYYDFVVGNIRKVYYDKNGTYNGVFTDYSYQMTGNVYQDFTKREHHKAYRMALTLVHEAVHVDRFKRGVDTGNRDTEEWFAIGAEKVVAEIIDAPQDIKDWLNEKYESKYWEE